MKHQVENQIEQLKAQYLKGQLQRAQCNLSYQERRELLEVQNALIKRLKYLNSLLNQRFEYN
jgi:hypothetical protein